MTATLTAPTPAPPASPPEPSEWARVTLENFAAIKSAEKTLSEPIPELSVDECLRVRQAVAWRPSFADQLKYAQLPQLVQETMGGVLGDIVTYVSTCASDGKKETVAGSLTDLLAGLDDAIVQRLNAGETGDLLLTDDLGRRVGDGLVVVAEKSISVDGHYLAGLVKRLPEDHPARGIAADLYQTDEGSALVLGPIPANTQPRRFYFYDRMAFWTGQFAKCQAQRLASRPLHQLSPAEIEKAKDREKFNNRLPPKPPLPTPVTTVRPSWVDNVLHTLELLPRVGLLWKRPPQDVPLADLLAVRAVLIRSDDPSGEDEPAFGQARPFTVHIAAARFAARYTGTSRRERLLELVTSLVGAIDKRLDAFVNDGSLWAARRHETLEAELAGLRTELADLRAEVKGRRKP